jgi:WD40 repeat protein
VKEIKPAALALWDLDKNQEIRRYKNRFPDSHIVLTHDGKSCFTSSGVFGVIRNWDIATGKDIQLADAPTDGPRWLAFSRDQKLLAAMSMNSVHVWDLKSGRRIHEQPLEPKQNIHLMRFTPDGKTLLLGGVSHVWALDTDTGKRAKHQFPGLELGANDYSSAELSPDGKTLAILRSGVTLWDWRNGKSIGTLTRNGKDLIQGGAEGFSADGPVAFSPDGKYLASPVFPLRFGPPQGGADRGPALPTPPRMQIWQLADKKLLRDWETTEVHPICLQYTGDGKALVGGFHNGTVCVWDTATGKEKVRFKHPTSQPSNKWIRVAPTGKLAATADWNSNLICFWDLTTGKQVGQFRDRSILVEGFQFSPDGTLLAMSATDTTVLILDVRKLLGN